MLHLARRAFLPFFSAVLFGFNSPLQAQENETPSGPPPGAGFSVVQNDRFAARVAGLPGAISVEASANPQVFAAARSAAISRAVGNGNARARLTSHLRATGMLGKRTPLIRSQIAAYTRDGALPTRTFSTTSSTTTTTSTKSSSIATRAVSPLFFKVNKASGFTDAQFTEFSDFLDAAKPAYSAIRNLYGDPAPAQQGRTVDLVYSAIPGDPVYELPPSGSTTSGGTIRFNPLVAGEGLGLGLTDEEVMRINEYNLLRQMFIAFHGAQVISFDAWELGMTDAAALIVAYQFHPSSRFDPSFLGYYAMPLYDVLNRPELGNPYFYTPGASPDLGFYRAAMAQSAWLKLWVQNNQVFKSFNSAYYTNYSNSGYPLAGNTPALKAIVKSICPTVEGLEFNDWYRRQQVLDTAVTTGEKLWLAAVPLANLVDGDTRSVFQVSAMHYRTQANGDEVPLAGTGSARAYSETGQDVTLLSDELRSDPAVQFDSLGEAQLNGQNVPSDETPIIGFEGTGTPDLARLRLVVTVGQAQSEALLPFGVAGTEVAPNGFYGVVVNSRSGSLGISTNGRSATVPLQRGAFFDSGRYPSSQRVVTTFTLTPSDGAAAKSWIRNSTWSFSGTNSQSFAAVLETAPGDLPFSNTFSFSGDNRMRLISLPLFPVKTDEADVLGVDPAKLLLARYRPNLAPKGFTQNGITYGVTADKHELYPNISEPFAPGRGYWLKLNQNLSTTVRGGEPSRSNNYDVPLLGGWNAIGVPFNRSFALSSIRVSYNGQTTDYAKAVAANWIGAGVWRWKPEGGYSRVDTGTAANQTLQPYEGYYIFSRFARGLKLTFVPGTTTVAALTRSTVTAENWRVAITARTSTARDDDGGWGVSALNNGQQLTRSAARPPAGTRSLTLSFLSSGNADMDRSAAPKASGWADSLVTPGAPLVWSGLVDGAWPDQTVTLNWGDISRLPVSINATFIDELTGQRLDMFQTRAFRYVATATARRFRIEAAPRPAAILTLVARPLAGSRSADLIATFGVPGRATLDIETPDGDLIRNIAAEAVVPGKRRWSWNGKNSAGTIMPVGTYIAHLRMLDDRGVETEKTVRFELS